VAGVTIQLVKKSGDAKLEVADQSGHAIPLEQPEFVGAAIQEMVTTWRANH
jgi:pimeloyl-ACP methyl ester carboxylesterase